MLSSLRCSRASLGGLSVLSILPADQKEGLPEHKVEEGKTSSGEGSEQQKQTDPISETFHAESDLQVRSGCYKLSNCPAKCSLPSSNNA